MATPYELGQQAALEKVALVPAALAAAAPWLARVGPWAARTLMPAIKAGLPTLGREMGMGALLGGGINAMTAQPGDRMGAALRGAGWGAVGGAAFKGVGGAANLMRGARDPATKMFAGGPMSNYLNQKGFMPWAARQATRPGVMGLAATSTLPTGQRQPRMPSMQNPEHLPMTNLPAGVGGF